MDLINDILNPLVRKLETELSFLAEGNVTWRFHSGKFEHIGYVRSYLNSNFALYLQDLGRKYPEIDSLFSKHDSVLDEILSVAKNICEQLAASEPFLSEVRWASEEWDARQPLKFDLPVATVAQLFAQYLINEIVHLKDSADHYQVFWDRERPRFVRFIDSYPEQEVLKELKLKLSAINADVIALLNDLRFSLVEGSMPTRPKNNGTEIPFSLISWTNSDRGTYAIVFTDVVGSTSLNEREGNRRWIQMKNAHFARMAETLRAYDGFQVKTMGDGAMCVFRTATDALSFCLDMTKNTGSPFVKIRAGIHIGTLIVEGNDIAGQAVSFAQRVSSKAGESEIYVSDRIKSDLSEEGFDWPSSQLWEEHADCSLGGFSGAYRLWSLRTVWPEKRSPNFPSEVQLFVQNHFPGYRVPGEKDIRGEWKEYGDLTTLSPFYCSGDFSGDGKTGHAFFVLSNTAAQYHVVMLRNLDDSPVVLYSGEGEPFNFFIRTLKPGSYETQWNETGTVEITRDAVNMGQFESSDWVFILQEDGTFDRIWMSD